MAKYTQEKRPAGSSRALKKVALSFSYSVTNDNDRNGLSHVALEGYSCIGC